MKEKRYIFQLSWLHHIRVAILEVWWPLSDPAEDGTRGNFMMYIFIFWNQAPWIFDNPLFLAVESYKVSEEK
jgi:hypothetical protein